MPADTKREKRIPNTVHEMAIWRQTINYELATAKNWKQNWGFMSDAYLDSPKSNMVKLPPIKVHPSSSGLPSLLPPGLSSSPDSLVTDWLYAHKVSRIITHKLPSEKYSIPATTSTEIGWPWRNVQTQLGLPRPSGDKEPVLGPVSLERYGRYTRGRGDVMKWFGGCRESLP